MPLNIHRKLLLVNFLAKVRELPGNLCITKELIGLHRNSLQVDWIWDQTCAPVLKRAELIEKQVMGKAYKDNPTSLTSPIPPWEGIGQYCAEQFSQIPVGDLSDERAQILFKAIQDSSRGYLEIYTDGSRKEDDNEVSVGAGMVIFKEEGKEYHNWRLPPEFCIMAAELFAIDKALKYLCENPNDGAIIYTDSLSSVSLIRQVEPSSFLPVVYSIQKKLYNLNKHRDTSLQFVPGHKGIPGNELADLTANAGHVLDIEKIPVPKEDQKRAAMNILCKHWSEEWKSEIANSCKGKHLEKIKGNIGHWPWAHNTNRLLESLPDSG